jgi:methanethiol S-methyltransferase
VWNVTNPAAQTIIWAVFWIGWATVLISTFLINHFELFGLQQAWLHLRGRDAAPPELRQPFFYRWIAHPLYSGFFLAFWAAPEMTAGHLLLAAGVSIYMLIAIRYEERDLTDLFGDDYRKYRSGVGMLMPRFGRRQA